MLVQLFWFVCVSGLLYFVWRAYCRSFDPNDQGDMEIKKKGAVFKMMYVLYSKTRVGHWYTQKSLAKAKLKFPDGHSALTTFTYGSLQITPIPVNYDNYTYLILDSNTGDVVLVDVSDVDTVTHVLEERELKPRGVLTTHKHWDHCCGNAPLKRLYPELQIYGAKVDRPNGVTKTVKHKEIISIGSLEFTCLLTPGHTSGHMTYHLRGDGHAAPDSLFTGDLLFLGGLGRMFEGTASTMLNSLDELMQCSDDTLIWSGHEYAKENTDFSSKFDFDNESLAEKRRWILLKRHDGMPTCPSTLGEEKSYNPFLRTRDPAMLKLLGVWPVSGEDENDESEVDIDLKMQSKALKALRVRKDKFRPKPT